MSNAQALEYAESLAATIKTDTEAGHPFGLSEGYGDTPEGEPNSAYDCLEDVLEFEYRVSSDGEYRSAKILVGFGGPNTWIDTDTHEIVCAWWSAPVRVGIPEEFCSQLDDAIALDKVVS